MMQKWETTNVIILAPYLQGIQLTVLCQRQNKQQHKQQVRFNTRYYWEPFHPLSRVSNSSSRLSNKPRQPSSRPPVKDQTAFCQSILCEHTSRALRSRRAGGSGESGGAGDSFGAIAWYARVTFLSPWARGPGKTWGSGTCVRGRKTEKMIL